MTIETYESHLIKEVYYIYKQNKFDVDRIDAIIAYIIDIAVQSREVGIGNWNIRSQYYKDTLAFKYLELGLSLMSVALVPLPIEILLEHEAYRICSLPDLKVQDHFELLIAKKSFHLISTQNFNELNWLTELISSKAIAFNCTSKLEPYIRHERVENLREED